MTRSIHRAMNAAAAMFACAVVACSSDAPVAAPGVATIPATPAPEDAAAPSLQVDASAPPSSHGRGGLICNARMDVAGRSICVATIGSIELKILEPKAITGPLRLGVYVHGDGAAAHKSGGVFKPMIAWADAHQGLGISFLAPNGCAWWQSPSHDCTSPTADPDLTAANAAALTTAIEGVLAAFDVRTDGLRYYGASGGSIFLTDEWLPLQGGRYPGAFAIMCGGEASPRAYAWDISDPSLRNKNPLWFTYGDQDFLLADERASVLAFTAKGFAVTERVVTNAGHCAFDAHSEAVGIWEKNP